jgi:hypothetical protein
LNAAWALAIALALQNPPPPAAAGPAWPDDRPITHLFQNLGKDLRALPSPATAVILAVGGGGTLASHAADTRLAGWTRTAGPSSYTGVGRVLGDSWLQGGGAVATYAAGKLAGNDEIAHLGGDLIRAQALNGVLTTALKFAIDRTRPSGGNRAFPSGHSSATFASAAILHAHFGWKAGVPAYAVAGFVGWTRLRDNQHWVSDVVFGSTIGVIVGQTVAAGHRQRTWTLVPTRTKGGLAVYLVR